MKELYLVSYSSGVYDSYHETIIFATSDKKKATRYVTKFKRLLKKWKNYYSQFEETEHGFKWIKEEHYEKHYKNWYRLRDINECYWRLIEER